MAKIVVIQGHPDPSRTRLCHALSDAYVSGAKSAGHEVIVVDLALIDFPFLQTQEDWQKGIEGTPETLREAQAACVTTDHFVFIYPLWLGTMPALLKAFIEQVFRPGVALSYDKGFPKPLLSAKSARIVITMGMPAFAYRWYFFAHGLKNLERSILGFAGVRPIRSTLFGMVENVDEAKRRGWLEKMKRFGCQAI